MTANKLFTKLLNKAHSKGLHLGGRCGFPEYDLARATARAIRIYAPKDGIIYIDEYDARLLYRIGEVTYRYNVQLSISMPGGGFPLYTVNLKKLNEALSN